MDFFPKRYNEIRSSNPVEKILLNINNNSERRRSLTMGKTNKALKGYIDGKKFKVIGTEMLISIFCVFKGELIQKDNDTIIKLNSEFHKTFKMLICIWSILPVFALIDGFMKIGVKAIFLLFPLAMVYVVIYFVINFVFKKSYENGIKDLKWIINQ